MTPTAHRLRRLRRILGYGTLLGLIMFAVLVGLAGQLLPLLSEHDQAVASWLSKQVGQPVSFSALEAQWTRRGPRLQLRDLKVGQGDRQLDIGHAQLLVSIYSGLFPGNPLTELTIRDLSLRLEQEKNRAWRLVGLPTAGERDPLEVLEGFGELNIQRAKLRVISNLYLLDRQVSRIDLRLRVYNDRIRAGAIVRIDEKQPPLQAVFDLSRTGELGKAWLGSQNFDYSQLGDLLKRTNIAVLSGSGQLDMWADIRERRLDALQLQAIVNKSVLESTAIVQTSDQRELRPRIGFDRLELTGRWHTDQKHWQMHAPRLRLIDSAGERVLDGLWLAGGPSYHLHAPNIDLGPVLAALSLHAKLPATIRAWLYEARPEGKVQALRIDGDDQGRYRGSTQLNDLGFLAVGERPGIRGLQGPLTFDDRGAVLRLDAPTAQLQWIPAFGKPLDLGLSGALSVWRDDNKSWSIGSRALRIQSTPLGISTRFALEFQNDRSKPSLDLSAAIDPIPLTAAKQFWVRHKMVDSAERWLDNALIDGSMEDARLIISGDLDNWPFRNGEGKFEGRAQIVDGTIRFNNEWPDGKKMNLAVLFDGPGFSLDGTGELGGNPIEKVTGGIESFAQPWLDLDIRSKTRAEKLRTLMQASPMNKRYAEHLQALIISGDASVQTKMRLPLKRDLGDPKIRGRIDFSDTAAQDTRWNIALDGMAGRVRFSEDGFAAEDLSARYDGQLGKFSLLVGSATPDESLQAEASLRGGFAIASLLDQQPQLAWIKPWVGGTSQWQISVRIPKTQADGKTAPARLLARSDLVGTTIGMPAPLRKNEGTPLTAVIDASLPLSAAPLQVRLGRLMQMRAQVLPSQPLAASVEFGSAPPLDLPERGIVVHGEVSSFDFSGWVAYAADNRSKNESSTELNSVDLRIGALDLLGRSFNDTNMLMTRGADAMKLVFTGDSIDGSLQIPLLLDSGIRGQFSRLYWPSLDTKAMTGRTKSNDQATDDVDNTTNPSRIPPLQFAINDLRFGDAQLGKASLKTYPTPEGMHIDQFQSTAKRLQINASGDWTRIGEKARSRFKMAFSAASLGDMLDALGFTGMVDDGPTKATFTGDWPGPPSAFRLDRFDGTLTANVGQGRLLEVEPGGSGRVLGLLSIAEIPRRLTFNFSDFFEKGFGFNKMQGDFRFASGIATTDNLQINGPSAEIRVRGATGLRDQTYDQTIEVLPKAGGVLPALGAVAGGPAGAAIGAVAQAVLQKPLKQVSRTVYQVSGPWQEPVVKVIEKGRTKRSKSEPSITAN